MSLVGPNLVANSNMAGGVAPNTLPGAWFLNSANVGTVTQTYAYGTEDGIPYIDFILTGTPGVGGTFQVVYGVTLGAQPLSVLPSNVYYHAANLYLHAGTWTNAVPQLSFQENNTGTGFIQNDQFYVGQNTTGTLGVNRFSGSTRIAANCNIFYGIFFINFAAASAISLTVRFGNPTIQLDDGLQSGGQRMVGWYQG